MNERSTNHEIRNRDRRHLRSPNDRYVYKDSQRQVREQHGNPNIYPHRDRHCGSQATQYERKDYRSHGSPSSSHMRRQSFEWHDENQQTPIDRSTRRHCDPREIHRVSLDRRSSRDDLMMQVRSSDRHSRRNPGHSFKRPRPDENQQRQRNKTTRPMGLKRFRAMIDPSISPENIVSTLAAGSGGLEERLKEQNDKDVLGLLLKVFSKMVECNDQPHCLSRVLTLLLQYEFDNKICDLIFNLPEETTKKIQEEASEHLLNALKLFESMLTVIPTSSHAKVYKSVTLITEVIDRIDWWEEELKNRFTQLKTQLEKVRDQQRDAQRRIVSNSTVIPPPDDFRHNPVFPEHSDVDGKIMPFLRPNLIDGAYQDTNHYLDVHFRLMREDFIHGLREGIVAIKNGDGAKTTSQNVRIYENVRIDSMKPGYQGVTHRLHFDNKNLRRVRWENSKRLISGNMVCLSADRFQEDLKFAVVCGRNVEDLEYGYLTVQFVTKNTRTILDDDQEIGNEVEEGEIIIPDDPQEGAQLNINNIYTMVETHAFYEAYRHVLSGIQAMHSVPLERYIVYCHTDLKPPKYLADSEEKVYYDFSMVTQQNETEYPQPSKRTRIDSEDGELVLPDQERVDILDDSSWPTAENLGLNTSQINALKLSLTKELALIQGPPGTGKTHVGLAIMKVLLGNKNKWRANIYDRCPILVVCYTNHALDQFLEGVLKFGAHNMVRLGGRCKNKNLERLTLFNRRRTHSYITDDGEAARFETVRWELKGMRNKLAKNLSSLKESRRMIVGRELLIDVIPDDLYDQFDDNETENGMEWLYDLIRQKEYIDTLYPHKKSSRKNEEFNQTMPFELDANIGMLNWLHVEIVKDVSSSIHPGGHENTKNGRNNDYANIQEEADAIAEKRGLDDVEDEWLTIDDIDVQLKVDDQMVVTSQQTGTSDKKAPPRRSIGVDKRTSKRLRENVTMTYIEENEVENIHKLHIDDRWRLYRTWVARWKDVVMRDIEEYNQLCMTGEELGIKKDAALLQNVDVIGATTTGAAKNRDLLRNLKCKIVVVEEAAEVLEAHVITAMPRSTEHLILIGDHQQLKPSPTVYNLAKEYNLDVSLFERLMGKIPHVTLTTQHRMRPEIADLLRPHIYETLTDHDSVKGRSQIRGVEKPVFFLCHSFPEDKVEDGKSKKNNEEAKFLIALCEYLIAQGYQQSQITILAMYSGQMIAFRDTMRIKVNLKGVRVSAVDNFQGEENDIILLSLVRSNDHGKIGFLGIKNRICVALSRAKHAFYCIGNMKLLASKSQLWRDIVCYLESKGLIGDTMMLCCQNHSETLSAVKSAQDFQKVPGGGCGIPCGYRLNCGHTCPRPCHPNDQAHKLQICYKPCVKILDGVCGKKHECTQRCFERCIPKLEYVQKELPDCLHEISMLCCKPTSGVRCYTLMEVTLPCGHDTRIPCHKTETLKITMCDSMCKTFLDCDHQCKGSCKECFQGRLHVPCKEICGRNLVCGHSCKANCSSCPPCEEKCVVRCLHNECGKLCGEPCTPCAEPCKWKCPHYKCTKLCGEPCDRPRCNEPCPKKIEKCGHDCIGLCGEPCPKLCRICNKNDVQEIFFGDEDEDDARFVELEDCGHVFTFSSLDHWMEQNEVGNAIKMKECPKCKTTIWQNMRYGNIINSAIRKINQVKEKLWGENSTYGQLMSEVRRNIKNTSGEGYVKGYATELMRVIKDKLKKSCSTSQRELHELTFRRLAVLEKLKSAARKRIEYTGITSYQESPEIGEDINAVKKWVMLPRTRDTEQDARCFQQETDKIKLAIKFLILECKAKWNSTKHQDILSEEIPQLRKLLLNNFQPFDEERAGKVKLLFEGINEKASGLSTTLDITDDEKKMICQAMGFQKKGHWYACPNGHVYCITECGGAMQESQCPECNVKIGGTKHTLVSSNRVATEMDGATRPAFGAANNRIPDDLLRELRAQGFG